MRLFGGSKPLVSPKPPRYRHEMAEMSPAEGENGANGATTAPEGDAETLAGRGGPRLSSAGGGASAPFTAGVA
eukprot:COSAG03_NODE_26784_length_257_cov_0.632911_1_plen_72_part_01